MNTIGAYGTKLSDEKYLNNSDSKNHKDYIHYWTQNDSEFKKII